MSATIHDALLGCRDQATAGTEMAGGISLSTNRPEDQFAAFVSNIDQAVLCGFHYSGTAVGGIRPPESAVPDVVKRRIVEAWAFWTIS
ncbi:hypothetical protein ABZ552_29010 [Nocardia sp. NPDC019219]|uniref:hypothetical protein n=1 Tax=Nocardia sp. NPDC019219 TaxID=3154590 RepID=UPI0033FE2C6E